MQDIRSKSLKTSEQALDTHTSMFSFKGRISVLAYMARTLFAVFFLMIAAGIAYFIVDETNINKNLQQVLAIGILLPPFWVTTMLLVKRLHDINMSGWWILTMFVPILGMIFSLYVGLLPGDQQENRFGHPLATKKWEKPIGIIGAIVVVFLGVGAAISELMEALGYEAFI